MSVGRPSDSYGPDYRFSSPSTRANLENVDAGGRLPVENELRKRLGVLGAEARAAVLRVLSLPDDKRAAAIATFYADPRLRPLAELMMDLEASPGVRAVLVTELREIEHDEA